MKAKTVNEVVSFQRYRDPKTALGMNYGKKPLTNAWKILEFVGSKKEEGVTYTEIQHFIWTVLWEKSEESFWKKDPWYKGMRISRCLTTYFSALTQEHFDLLKKHKVNVQFPGNQDYGFSVSIRD